MSKSLPNPCSPFDSALDQAEACIAILNSMLRTVSTENSGDEEFDADIKKSISIALADTCRWYLLKGTYVGRFDVVVPEEKQQ